MRCFRSVCCGDLPQKQKHRAQELLCSSFLNLICSHILGTPRLGIGQHRTTETRTPMPRIRLDPTVTMSERERTVHLPSLKMVLIKLNTFLTILFSNTLSRWKVKGQIVSVHAINAYKADVSIVQQPLMDQGLPIIKASRSYSDTPHSVEVLSTGDQPDVETSTWQHTTLTRNRYPYRGGTRTHNFSKRTPADPRLRLRGH
jgi:hypothetical protein